MKAEEEEEEEDDEEEMCGAYTCGVQLVAVTGAWARSPGEDRERLN